MAELVDGYPLWKDGPWYHDVDWRQVAAAADEVLQRLCRDGVADRDGLRVELGRLGRSLSRVDAEGLHSLADFPVEVTRNQLHNGGHRLSAMRRQGVPVVPGACLRADVGAGIDAASVYPTHDASRGGRSSSENPE